MHSLAPNVLNSFFRRDFYRSICIPSVLLKSLLDLNALSFFFYNEFYWTCCTSPVPPGFLDTLSPRVCAQEGGRQALPQRGNIHTTTPTKEYREDAYEGVFWFTYSGVQIRKVVYFLIIYEIKDLNTSKLYYCYWFEINIPEQIYLKTTLKQTLATAF